MDNGCCEYITHYIRMENYSDYLCNGSHNNMTSPVNIIIASTYSFCGLTAAIVNVLSIIVLVRSRIVHSIPGSLLVHLAFADASYGIVAFLISGPSMYLGCWPYNEFLLQAFGLLLWTLLYESVFVLLVIAIERYLCLTSNRLHQAFFKKRLLQCILSTWVFNFSNQALEFMFESNVFYYHLESGMLRRHYHHVWSAYYFVTGYLIPMTVALVIYAKILRIIRLHRNKIHADRTTNGRISHVNSCVYQNNQRSTRSRAKGQSPMRLIKMFLIITVLYVLIYTPTSVIFASRHLIGMDVMTEKIFTVVLTVLMYANPVIDCIIYNVSIASFREEMVRVLMCRNRHVDDAITDIETYELSSYPPCQQSQLNMQVFHGTSEISTRKGSNAFTTAGSEQSVF